MPNDIRLGYKVLTYNYCSPLQGGAPLWDGVTFPWSLPPVALDMSMEECAAGWNYCASLAEAWPLAGLWRCTRPTTAFVVEGGADAIQRGTKRRASTLTLVRRCTEDEIAASITEYSRVFTPHHERMASEQCAWRTAFVSPSYDATVVEVGLQTALAARGLSWALQRCDSATPAWTSIESCDVWLARATWAHMAVSAVRNTCHDARDVRAALSVVFAALHGWISMPVESLTVGIRNAYAHGLKTCFPMEGERLGWCMTAQPERRAR